MACHTNENGAKTNLTANKVDANKMLGALGRMTNAKQQYAEALQACVMAVLDRVVVLRNQHPREISGFRHFRSPIFLEK